MCWKQRRLECWYNRVSVAGCLGYDVLVGSFNSWSKDSLVSVAGCLGYDVLGQAKMKIKINKTSFSCWLFRL